MYLPLMTQPVLGILAIIFAWAVPSVPEIVRYNVSLITVLSFFL